MGRYVVGSGKKYRKLKEIETGEKEMEAREKQLEASEKQIKAQEQKSPTLKQITPNRTLCHHFLCTGRF